MCTYKYVQCLQRDAKFRPHFVIFVDFIDRWKNQTCPSGIQNSCSFSFSSSLIENRAMNSKKERLGTESMSKKCCTKWWTEQGCGSWDGRGISEKSQKTLLYTEKYLLPFCLPLLPSLSEGKFKTGRSPISQTISL